MPNFTHTPTRLAQHLIKKRLLSSATLQEACSTAKEQKIPLIHYLVQQNYVNSAEILSCAAELFQLSTYDLSTYDVDTLPKKQLSLALIKQHYVLPLCSRQDHVVLAVADPSEYQAIEDFNFVFEQPCVITIVDAKQLQALIKHIINQEHKSQLHASLQTIAQLDPPLRSPPSSYHQTDETPVTIYVQQLLQDAVDQKISDIHCEPYADFYRIRLRQDGLLVDYASPPTHVAPRLAARIKIMAELNITDRRLPQDGRFEFITQQGHSIDIRVSVCPVVHGEKLVLRLLNSTPSPLLLEHLGLEPHQEKQLHHALQQKHGLILITGPTGSGKTITLYSMLHYLNNGECNISTVEDPVEIQLPGINQVPIQPSIGLDFSYVLRCLLRQDPDIIMIGEIRDSETAQIACKAAQTGHLVLSTLHTHNAASALIRMQQLGISTSELANSLKLIIAQRLVRRLCAHCHSPIDERLTRVSEPIYIYKACTHCNNGYQGRTGIFEFLMMNEKWKHLMATSAPYHKIEAYAQQQDSLQEAGLYKVKQGITDSKELKRIL